VTYDKDLAEAKRMAEDAIKACIKSLVKYKEAVPSDDLAYVANVNFNVSKLNNKFVYA